MFDKQFQAMRKVLLLSLLNYPLLCFATPKDSTLRYDLPDSVRAVQFISTLSIPSFNDKKEMEAGIGTDVVRLSLENEKSSKKIVFEFPSDAIPVASGFEIRHSGKDEMEWKYNWEVNEKYRLLIAVASDSAENFSLYTGYCWLSKEAKWKLIGTVKIKGRWTGIKGPIAFYESKEKGIAPSFSETWVQRNNNSWKKLSNEDIKPPVINLLSHIDSVAQFEKETAYIQKMADDGITDAATNIRGVHFEIYNPGTGRHISVDDTVTVLYKLTAFRDTAIIDQTTDKPAVFPLKRLIVGWQLAVPLIRTGGKIKLVIPSAHGYSIRTRSAKIPPNTILEFMIEVVDSKPPVALKPAQ